MAIVVLKVNEMRLQAYTVQIAYGDDDVYHRKYFTVCNSGSDCVKCDDGSCNNDGNRH